MSINFLHPELQPTIECNTIASEGHEIGNLISSNQFVFQKGFLAERFISGPVTITVRFLCSVNIKYIIIWSKVSNQKSLGFELSSLKYTNQALNETEFKRFASGFIASDANGILLHKEGLQIPMDKHSPDVQLFTKRTFLRSRNYENVIEVRIKIFKSQYVPAVKKIEVWGEPSPLCDRETKTKVHNVWSQIQRRLVSDQVPVLNDHEDNLVETHNVPLPRNDLIPEEFYDQITNEVMTLPMILPSGKIIDHQTLERFQNEEACWGRPPSDPFTGIIFTDRCKPAVATVLKAKIDAYLLANSDLEVVKSLPRRLGSVCPADFKVSKILDKKVASKRKLVSATEENTNGITRKHRIDENRSETDQAACSERLEKILRGYPSFLSAPVPERKSCVNCIECSTSEQLYTLPCAHLMCRVCVIRNEHRCRHCQKSFTFAEVQKVHVIGPLDSL